MDIATSTATVKKQMAESDRDNETGQLCGLSPK
jgi:hypothetical protein